MTDERYDYYQSQMQRDKAAHRTPISPPRMPREAENHAKDGPCKTIQLPNLPSVGGRVKYAMGAMNVGEFSQRTGISISYLTQICNGKAKTVSAFNANRIAAASPMGVTVGWLLGLPQKSAPEPSAPTKQVSQELPDLPDFWARLQWAVDRDGRSLACIERAAGFGNGWLSYLLGHKSTPSEAKRQTLADGLHVPEVWLCAGLKSDNEICKARGKKKAIPAKNASSAPDEAQTETPARQPAQSSGTHLHFEGVYSGDVLSALVSVLKGTYRVNLTIDEVETAT